jgi:hypothetical protein
MSMDNYLATVEEKIAKYGWMVQAVGAGEEEPQFFYTVGLTRLGLPEVITFGLPMDVGQTLMNDVAIKMQADKLAGHPPIENGTRRSDILQGFDVVFVEVLDTTKHLTVANTLCSNGLMPVRALQMIWPDPKGRFPWDPSFKYGDKIPVLGVRVG